MIEVTHGDVCVDDVFFALGVDDEVDGGYFFAGGPAFGCRESVGPGEAGIVATFVDDGSAAVAFGVNAKDGFIVFEQDGGGVTEVLAGLTVDDRLAVGLVGQIEDGDGVVGWLLGGGGCEECRN